MHSAVATGFPGITLISLFSVFGVLLVILLIILILWPAKLSMNLSARLLGSDKRFGWGEAFIFVILNAITPLLGFIGYVIMGRKMGILRVIIGGILTEVLLGIIAFLVSAFLILLSKAVLHIINAFLYLL